MVRDRSNEESALPGPRSWSIGMVVVLATVLMTAGSGPAAAEDAAAPAAEPAAETEPAGEADGGPQETGGNVPAAGPVPPPAAREPAADGTVSVVVDPPTAPAQPVVPPPATPPPVAAAPPTRQAAGPPAVPPVEPPPANAATDLLSKSLEPLEARQPSGGDKSAERRLDSLSARPLSLLEALQRSGDPARRLWITQAYWKASAGFAHIRWATESIERLELIAPGGDPHDRAALDVAAASAAADLADARAELVAAQQELVDLIRLPVGEPLPWPVDRPLAGPYQTHFDAIFAARPATGRIRAIDRMLPSKYAALESRASAVIAAERALQMTEADHAKGKRPIESVVAAHAALLTQQREFLGVLKAYNLDIAEYVMAVADLSVPDDRFVSMLIGTPIQWRPTVAPSGLPPVPPQTGPATGQPGDGILP
jgi:hypothetical protein